MVAAGGGGEWEGGWERPLEGIIGRLGAGAAGTGEEGFGLVVEGCAVFVACWAEKLVELGKEIGLFVEVGVGVGNGGEAWGPAVCRHHRLDGFPGVIPGWDRCRIA